MQNWEFGSFELDFMITNDILVENVEKLNDSQLVSSNHNQSSD